MKLKLKIMQIMNIYKPKKEEINIKILNLNYFLGEDSGVISIYFMNIQNY